MFTFAVLRSERLCLILLLKLSHYYCSRNIDPVNNMIVSIDGHRLMLQRVIMLSIDFKAGTLSSRTEQLIDYVMIPY